MTLGKMLKDLFRSVWIKPSTLTELPPPVADARRRIHYDSNSCTKCGLCIRHCPSNTIEKNDQNNLIFHLDRCIGCAQCVDVCIKGCITCSGQHLTAKVKREEF